MTTSTNRGYDLPAHGADVDTWDVPVNANMNLLDLQLGATIAVSLTNVNVTLSGAQYKYGNIQFTGTLTGNVIITFPAVAGWWSVENATTGAFYIQLTCGGGSRVCAPPQETVDIITDGTNIKYRNLGRIGSYMDYSGTATPNWITNCTVPPYLYCDGSSFSAVTYPRLNTILGGTTLPDFRGRGRFFLNDGTSRLTTAGSGVDGNTILASGGAQNKVIAQVNLPAYNLTFSLAVPTALTNGANVTTDLSISNDSTSNSGPGASFDYTRKSKFSFNSVTLALASGAVAGTVSLGGSGTALAIVPPAVIGGLTYIRAA